MKKIVLQTEIQVFSKASDLTETDQQLLQLARASLDHSYSPYSQFQVGAALLLANGEMMGGSNQENASYPLCLCAERVAISAAASQFPKEAIRMIAITARNPKSPLLKPVTPCGACRQVICETEQKHQQEMRIIMQGESGDIYVLEGGKSLLPFSFDSSFLLDQ